MTMVGEIATKAKSNSNILRSMTKSDGKKFGRHGDAKGKTKVAKRGGCYICGGLHGYARCLELKSIHAIMRERKKGCT